MEKEKPLILVSNDDGVMAKGINELVKFLRPLGEIIVMAPDAPRSGSGCALTVTQPVHYQLVKKEVGTDRLHQIGTKHSARPDSGSDSRRYQSWR